LIDWITCKVHGVLHRPISAGHVVALKPDGSVDWHSPRRASLADSSSATVLVVSSAAGHDGFSDALSFSGNPSKFLQGHNLYGSDDLPGLIYECIARAIVHGLHLDADRRDVQPDPIEQVTTLHALSRAIAAHPRDYETQRTASESWRGRTTAPVATLPGQNTRDPDSPHVSLSRVDVNYMADVGSDHDARQWIGAAGRFATFANRSGSLTGASTVYFGSSSSERGRLKFYCKGPEFREHPPEPLKAWPDELQPVAYLQRELLQTHATGKLRAELMLRGKRLQELGLRYAADWNSNTARRTFIELMEKFDMPQPADTLDTSALPRHLGHALHAWRGGANLQTDLPRRTWYRYRRELRELAGVDIAQPCSDPLPPLELHLPVRTWPRNVVELFPADDEPAPVALVAAGLYFEPRTDWRIEHRPAPSFPLPARRAAPALQRAAS